MSVCFAIPFLGAQRYDYNVDLYKKRLFFPGHGKKYIIYPYARREVTLIPGENWSWNDNDSAIDAGKYPRSHPGAHPGI